MTRMTAKAEARVALERRKLIDRAEIVRGRAEAFHQLQLGRLVAQVDQALSLAFYTKAADLLDDIDDRIQRHMADIEAADLARAGQMQDQLLGDRGVETHRTGAVRTRDGWRIVCSANRLTPRQVRAGDMFRAQWDCAHRDGLSSANDNGAGGEVDMIQRRVAARERLMQVRAAIRYATGSEGLYALLSMVCGEGHTLRQIGRQSQARDKEREALIMEGDLRVALDMTAQALDLV